MRGSTEPKPSIKDRILGYFEEAAMDRGLLPQGVYPDGRTWRRGRPRKTSPRKSRKDRKRSRSPSPSRRDKIMGYLEGKAMDRGLLPQGVYLDGRTWKHGKPYTARTSKS